MQPVETPNVRQNTPSYDELEAQIAKDEQLRALDDRPLDVQLEQLKIQALVETTIVKSPIRQG